jgi:hypothetical protein
MYISTTYKLTFHLHSNNTTGVIENWILHPGGGTETSYLTSFVLDQDKNLLCFGGNQKDILFNLQLQLLKDCGINTNQFRITCDTFKLYSF